MTGGCGKCHIDFLLAGPEAEVTIKIEGLPREFKLKAPKANSEPEQGDFPGGGGSWSEVDD